MSSQCVNGGRQHPVAYDALCALSTEVENAVRTPEQLSAITWPVEVWNAFNRVAITSRHHVAD